MAIETIVSAPLGVAGEYPSHQASLGKGGIHVFSSIAERDAMWDELKDISTIAVVGNGENGYPSLYKWESNKWNFEGYFGGSVVADVDGALPKKVDTFVFGEGFSVQDAGNQGNGALVQYTPPQATGGSSDLEVTMTPDTQYGAADVKKIRTETPLMVADNPDEQNSVKMYIKHDAFEAMHKPSLLAYVKGQKFIDKDTAPVTADVHSAATMSFEDVVFGANNVYVSLDANKEAVTIQEADSGDPSITGGTDYLVSFRASMKGTAPSDGSVMMYIYDSSVSPFDKDTYLEDVTGNPLVAVKHYNSGDKLGVTDVTGIVNAKGMKSFTCHLVTDFNESIELNDRFYGGTGLVVQAITSESKTGEAILQFEIDTDNRIWFEYDEVGGYKLKEAINYGMTKGVFEEHDEAFIQDTQGFAALRYTVNKEEIPLPCGIAKKGSADVSVDASVNQVGGSLAKGGEGAIKFNSDGNASISTTLRVDNETGHGSTLDVWWATVAADGSMTKIVDSEKTVTVFANTKNQTVLMPSFSMLVEAGDRIALRAKTDYVDGVFIQTTSDRYPLVETIVDFKEIVQGA